MHKIIKLILGLNKTFYRLRFVQNLLFKFSSNEIVVLKENFRLNLKTGDMISNYIYHFNVWEPNISKYLN